MEEADVKQLFSLIESAQFQCEVDESGTVSIVCDPGQLNDSAGQLLTETDTSLLSQGLDPSLVSSEDGGSEAVLAMGEDGEGRAQADLPLSHYFLHTDDGQILQVLGRLGQEDGVEQDRVEEGQERGGGEVPGEAQQGVQILLVGSSDGEDVYLISTGGKEEDHTQDRGPMCLSSVLQDTGDTPQLKENNTILTLASSGSSVQKKVDDQVEESKITPSHDAQDGQAVELCLMEQHPDPALSVPLPDADQEPQSVAPSIASTDKKQPLFVNLKAKPRIPLKMQLHGCVKSLREGTVVHTDKGDMIAYNLSSKIGAIKAKQRTSLHNVASVFGSAVKVLKPVVNVEPKGRNVCKKFSIYSCKDCGSTLHSERSLLSHQRRHHQEYKEECFICGQKFLHTQALRAHIQEVHSKENTSFQCRFCSYVAMSVKEILRHRFTHKDPQVCQVCGKKYFSPKFFREHVASCKAKEKLLSSETSRDSVNNSEENVTISSSKTMEETSTSLSAQRNDSANRNKVSCSGGRGAATNMSSVCQKRRKPLKSTYNNQGNSTKNDRDFKGNSESDKDFKLSSKHYSDQMKHLTQEQPQPKQMRSGRGRTNRCYLCFKTFSSVAELTSHKETYHQVQSDRPVRVKTDLGLGEKEEEGFVGKTLDNCDRLSQDDEIVIKTEPVNVVDKFENITIVLDECMSSMEVIKPQCIACQGHTSVDHRKCSKWFSIVPDEYHYNLLKKFEHFFPCVLRDESVVQQWKLCQKCVLLIDKLADMENKLNTMKTDDLTFNLLENDSYQDSCVTEGLPMKDLSENNTTSSKELQNKVDGVLGGIEAYMKGKCEIFEVTKPQKRPGRPCRQAWEKLTPLLSEEDMNACMSEMVAMNVHPPVKQESVEVTDTMEETGASNTTEQCDEMAGREEVRLGDKIIQEAVPHSPNLVNTDSVSTAHSWDGVVSSSSSLHGLSEDISSEGGVKGEPDGGINRNDGRKVVEEQLSEQKSGRQLAVKLGYGSESLLVDPADDEVCEHFPFSLPSDCTTPEAQSEKKEYLEGKQTSSCIVTEEQKRSRVELEGLGKDAGKAESSTPLTEPMKKRARLKEEREKMCYFTEGLSKPWQCSECHKGFSSKRGACDHYTAHHKGQNYACEECSASYVRKRDLIGHYNKVHLNIKPYKCKVAECSETFSSHNDLYRHLQFSHSSQGQAGTTFSCHMCKSVFAQKRYRDAHLPVCASRSSSLTPYRCTVCGKAFKLLRYLQNHMRFVHCKNEQYFCEICYQVLSDKRNLILHMKSHMGETKVSCEVCGKEFNRKSYLFTHMRVHSGHRPYGCNYCPKWFKQYSTWKNHERTHTKEKPYKCMLCEATFVTSSSASKHMQYAHLNIRDHQCTLCSKSFISKAKLYEHTKVHTGEKPFKCPVCHRAFNKKNNLRAHMYVHSSSKRYRCELCGEDFMRRSAIENHILEVHKIALILDTVREGESCVENRRQATSSFILDTAAAILDGEGDSSRTNQDPSVTVSSSPFISVGQANDGDSSNSTQGQSYIVVYVDEDAEDKNCEDMQVTVQAEDSCSEALSLSRSHLSPSTSGSSRSSLDSVEPAPNVLTEVILEGLPDHKSSESSTTLLPHDVVDSTITLQSSADPSISHVMEMDPTHFSLVVTGDSSVRL